MIAKFRFLFTGVISVISAPRSKGLGDALAGCRCDKINRAVFIEWKSTMEERMCRRQERLSTRFKVLH
jgi:hypothetical protein